MGPCFSLTMCSSNSQSPSPPSSSVAYSMLSGGSSEQDPPSTSGCSSDHPARVQTQRELLRALRELKIRMPTDHRGKGRSSTLASLQYALNCVKQVRGESTHGNGLLRNTALEYFNADRISVIPRTLAFQY